MCELPPLLAISNPIDFAKALSATNPLQNKNAIAKGKHVTLGSRLKACIERRRWASIHSEFSHAAQLPRVLAI